MRIFPTLSLVVVNTEKLVAESDALSLPKSPRKLATVAAPPLLDLRGISDDARFGSEAQIRPFVFRSAAERKVPYRLSVREGGGPGNPRSLHLLQPRYYSRIKVRGDNARHAGSVVRASVVQLPQGAVLLAP